MFLQSFDLRGIVMTNTKKTGSKATTLAAKTLRDPSASKIQKTLAGSTLAQSGTSKQTSKAVETKASTALKSSTTNAVTKSLAGSAVSQSKKKP
jgi:glycosyltransferase A (GT-A) superfamily protein (DUF2064 family)